MPPSGEDGATSVNVVPTAGLARLSPRLFAAVSSTSRISVSSTTSFCSTSSWSMRLFARRIEYGLPVSTSCVPFGGTVIFRSGACDCIACVTVVAMSVAEDDGAPFSPGAAAFSETTSIPPLGCALMLSALPACCTGGPPGAAKPAPAESSWAIASAMRWCCVCVASTESALRPASVVTCASRNERAIRSPTECAST